MTDLQIRQYVKKLQNKGASLSDIETFVRLAKQQQSSAPKESSIDKASGAINKLYEGYKNLPGIKKFSQAAGTLVGRVGAVMGQAGAAPFELIKSGTDLIRGKSAGQVYKESKQRMGYVKSGTQQFGTQVGSESVPAATLGVLGRVPSAIMAAQQAYEGSKGLRQSLKTGDVVGLTQSGLQFGTSLLGAKGALGTGKQGLFLDPGFKAQAKTEIKELREAWTGKSSLDKVIDTSIEKAIRPSVVSRRTADQTVQYNKKARTAVKTITKKKNSLAIIDESGAIKNLPESVKEFSDAISQTKKLVFEEYDAIKTKAEGKKAAIDLRSIADELDVVANNRVLNDIKPEIANYAAKQADRFRKRKYYSANDAQEAIRIYNESLESFYRNPNYDTASKAVIDAAVVNNLRKKLDTIIESTTGEKYQELKSQYGALKSIEKDVNHRATVDARKNIKGLIDFTDIFSGGQIMNGLLSLNPGLVASGVFQKGIASYFKRLNDPNIKIKQMFNVVDRSIHGNQRKSILKSDIYPGLSIKDVSKNANPSMGKIDPKNFKLKLTKISKIFQSKAGSEIAPISKYITTENVPLAKAQRAYTKIQEAILSGRPPRKPISAITLSDGRKLIVDGNSTYAALKQAGYDHIVVEDLNKNIVKDLELDKISLSSKATDYQIKISESLSDAQRTNYLQLKKATGEVFHQFNEGFKSVKDSAVKHGIDFYKIYEPQRKGDARAIEKIITEEKGNFNAVKDMNRATFVVKKVTDIPKLIELIDKRLDISRLKNRIAKPTGEGYRDIMLNVRMANGTHAEIQILLPEMASAKDSSHVFFEETRTATTKQIAGELSKEEEYSALKAYLQQLQNYSEAWVNQKPLYESVKRQINSFMSVSKL